MLTPKQRRFLKAQAHHLKPVLHVGKSGVIPSTLAPILERLGLRNEHWQETAQEFGDWFTYVAGRAKRMIAFAMRPGLAWVRGLRRSRRIFA